MNSEGVVRVHLRTSANKDHWHKDLPFVLFFSEGLYTGEQLEALLPPKSWPRSASDEITPRKQSQEMVRGEISSPLRCSS